MIVEEASEVSDSASRVGTQSHQPQLTRPWRQVNEDVSARMIAMSSDSPPVIPKRDYEDSPRPRGQQMPPTTVGEQSGEDIESGEEDGRQRAMDESAGQLVLYQGARPPHGPFDGSIYGGEPFGFMPCPPGPMWPMPIPMPPMYPPPPPPPPPFFHPGMDGLHPFVCADPGILFTPMGPVPVFDASQHRRNHKKAMKRSHSLELRSCGPPPMFVPPPGAPFLPPMGFQEPSSMPMPGGPAPMMMLGGGSSMMLPMQQQSMVPRMPPTGKRPMKAKPPKPPKKHSACYLVCCKGHTQVLWIVVGIILVGIVLGLVLGLTLV